jgi:biopolymer transport protein TolQ
MSTDLSFFHLIMGASMVVKLVLLLLLTVSMVSWTMIFRRRAALRDAQEAADDFEDRFWAGGDLSTLYREVSSGRDEPVGMADIFQAGFSEFARLRKQSGTDSRSVVEGAQRVMRVALSRETEDLETHLSFLATVGSTSPYVGLFGTVWGIMNSFRGLGNAQQATLSMVAPGIAEALIATAMGLFAAIPAVIAYNRYSNDVERLINRYDNFLEEFSTILQRQVHGAPVQGGRRATDSAE